MENSRHHRKPRSIGGSNEPPNTVKVPHHKHEAWHILFKNMTAQQIFEEINNIWIDPDYKIALVPTKREVPY